MAQRIVTPTGATGVLEESNRVTILNPFPADATKFLDGTGAFSTPTGSGGTVTHTGTLTANKAIIGNGTADVTVSAASGVAHLSSGTLTGSNVVESEITLANNTTNNVSTSAHGFTPILPNDATKYLDGTGAYTVPAGTSTGTVTHTGSLTSGTLVQGNGSADVTLNATTATVTKLTAGVPSAATAGTDYTDAAFKTISVSGQSDVVADSAADTLTLAAGSGVTITTNAGTDTVTISATGSGGNVTTSATLTANQVILGNGSGDIKNLGSLGTTTTVLHGNAAGAPSFAAVALAADVSGTLPVSNGGIGVGTLTGIAKGNGTSAFTAATDGTDYVSPGTLVSMSVLTSGTGATYTVPSSVNRLFVRVQGGGGGGGGGDQSATLWGCGSGGGAGGYAEKVISTSPAATFTYTIGAAAAGGTAGNNSGTAGNATTWDSGGSPVVGNGGGAGGSMAAGSTLVGATPGSGGTATGGTVNITGGNGDLGLRFTASNVMSFAAGGNSPLGAGSTMISSGVGANGTGYGSGGGGGVAFLNSSDVAGGNGAAGVIIVLEYK